MTQKAEALAAIERGRKMLAGALTLESRLALAVLDEVEAKVAEIEELKRPRRRTAGQSRWVATPEEPKA